MNTYSVKFHKRCPNNGIRIEYTLEIETDETVMVERIMQMVEGCRDTYHEQIAADLKRSIGADGKYTLSAHHHGVDVRTVL